MQLPEEEWMLRRPELRFSYNPIFLQLPSSAAPLHSAKSHIPKSTKHTTALAHMRSTLPVIQLSSARPTTQHESAASIARAMSAHKASQRRKTINILRDLKIDAANAKTGIDVEKNEKMSVQKLMREMRTKCLQRLTERRDPMRGEIMRAIDEPFITHLLNDYQGYSMSVDAILAMIGSSANATCFPTPLNSEDLFQESSLDSTSIRPVSRSYSRPISPIKLIAGIGYRPQSSAFKRLTPANIAKTQSIDDETPNTVVTRSSSVIGNNEHQHSSTFSREESFMVFTDSEVTAETNAWRRPLRPYAVPTKPRAPINDEDWSTPQREKWRADKMNYLQSLDTNSKFVIVVPDRKLSYDVSVADLTEASMKQDIYGVWRPKSRRKTNTQRPFVSTT